MMNNLHSKIKTVIYLCVILLVNYTNAQRTINCDNDDCLEAAMANALPGDEIILEAGVTFIGGSRSAADNFSAFSSDRDGTSANPIILRGASSTNKSIISANRSGYSWYGINLSGDYWVIKDIVVRGVLKGIVLDDANYCELLDLEVYEIGQEAIHLRTGSSNNLVKGCIIRDTGKRSDDDKGFGEGVYVGSDRSAHNRFDPNCNNNFIENCVFGPNISAEALDIKEGTERTVVRNNTFFASGVSGVNSADSFIDLKGIYGYVYGNIFNVLENAEPMNSVVDVSNRTFGSYDYKTGTHSAIFENTINLSEEKSNIPTTRIILDPERQPTESRNIHSWDNTRNPSTGEVVDNLTSSVVQAICPAWNEFRSCTALSITDANLNSSFTIYPNPVSNEINIAGIDLSKVKQAFISSLEGKILYNFTAKDLNTTIDVSALPNGIYIMTFTTPSSTISKKLLKI